LIWINSSTLRSNEYTITSVLSKVHRAAVIEVFDLGGGEGVVVDADVVDFIMEIVIG
jgi:Flp pilus assembly protein CpaB